MDRFDPRNVLAFDALAIFALTIAIGSMNDIVAIYVLWTILSVFVMCLSNARTVLMTQVFSRGDIVEGNSLVLSFLNVARLLTPLAAGFLSRFLVFKTIVPTVFIYLGCGVASMLLESRRREGGNHRCVGKAMAQVREGFRFIWSAKSIRAMAEIGIGVETVPRHAGRHSRRLRYEESARVERPRTGLRWPSSPSEASSAAWRAPTPSGVSASVPSR